MKRFLSLLLICFCASIKLFADEGRGSCIINGTENDYVEVTVFSAGGGSGNYVIANSSSKPLMSVYIDITADVKKPGTNTYETKTLYSGNYTEKIEPYQSKSVDFTYPNSYKDIRNIVARVSNPTCR